MRSRFRRSRHRISSALPTTAGLLTELVLARREGTVLDRGDHVVIATPGNPGYYFGNCLLFNRPPAAADHERWLALFSQTFAHDAGVRHVAFAWSSPDGTRGEVAAFVADGFTLNENVVLAAERVAHGDPPARILIAQLRDDAHWNGLMQLQLRMRDAQFEPRAYEAFVRRRLAKRRELCRDGGAAWIGAFSRGELVGSCGIFSAGELARFQDVVVDERYRNRGIARALVACAARIAFERLQCARLVIVADAAYHALGLYERAGFAPIAREWALWKSP